MLWKSFRGSTVGVVSINTARTSGILSKCKKERKKGERERNDRKVMVKAICKKVAINLHHRSKPLSRCPVVTSDVYRPGKRRGCLAFELFL